jgi:hypothetical protein
MVGAIAKYQSQISCSEESAFKLNNVMVRQV